MKIDAPRGLEPLVLRGSGIERLRVVLGEQVVVVPPWCVGHVLVSAPLLLAGGSQLVLYQWLGGAAIQASCPSVVTRNGACSWRSG